MTKSPCGWKLPSHCSFTTYFWNKSQNSFPKGYFDAKLFDIVVTHHGFLSHKKVLELVDKSCVTVQRSWITDIESLKSHTSIHSDSELARSGCKLPLKAREEDKEVTEEATTSLTAAKGTTVDAAVVTVFSELPVQWIWEMFYQVQRVVSWRRRELNSAENTHTQIPLREKWKMKCRWFQSRDDRQSGGETQLVTQKTPNE